MAIEFTKTQNQKVDFGRPNIYALSERSISVWVNLDSIATTNAPRILGAYGNNADDEAFVLLSGFVNNGDIFFEENFTDTNGAWHTAINTLSVSTWHHIVVTYDPDDVVNDPIIYIDSVSKSLTELATPVGTRDVGTGGAFSIGAAFTGSYPIDGKVEDPRIYNRILSQADVNELYLSRNQRSVIRGIVFAPFLDGAAGLSRFDGATLGTANVIKDWISGVSGTPNGNPIGRGNTIQRIY